MVIQTVLQQMNLLLRTGRIQLLDLVLDRTYDPFSTSIHVIFYFVRCLRTPTVIRLVCSSKHHRSYIYLWVGAFYEESNLPSIRILKRSFAASCFSDVSSLSSLIKLNLVYLYLFLTYSADFIDRDFVRYNIAASAIVSDISVLPPSLFQHSI